MVQIHPATPIRADAAGEDAMMISHGLDVRKRNQYGQLDTTYCGHKMLSKEVLGDEFCSCWPEKVTCAGCLAAYAEAPEAKEMENRIVEEHHSKKGLRVCPHCGGERSVMSCSCTDDS